MTAETSGEGETEDHSTTEGMTPAQTGGEAAVAAQAPGAGSMTTEAPPQVEGRRTQLKIVRETIQSLSSDIARFRKSHEASSKRLEAQVASLRKELATHTRSKDLGNHVKSHESDTKRLEKQVATLRSELTSLKAHVSKEAAKSRAKEEAAFSRMLAKVRAQKPSKKLQLPTRKNPKKKR